MRQHFWSKFDHRLIKQEGDPSNVPSTAVFGIARLINKYDIAIGFEESSLDRTHRRYYFETNIPTDELKAEYSGDKVMVGSMPPFSENLISVDFKDAKLSEVLDCIVKQMANYKWEINDQVVNITPVNGRDLRLKELLERQNFELLPACRRGSLRHSSSVDVISERVQVISG